MVLTLVLACPCAAALAIRRLPGLDPPSDPDRATGVDGLRGWLALSVFVYHAALWRTYLASGEWTVPDSSALAHAGRSAVAAFFMITGFLFFAKLRRSGPAGPDWRRLYVGRVLRIGPLYLVVVAAMLGCVALASGGEMRVDPAELARSLAHWAALGAAGRPDVNGVERTFVIVAGVTWTLRYEWLFYALLPLAALASGRRTSPAWLLASAAALAGVAASGPDPALLACFGVGMLAAVLADVEPVARRARSRAVAGAACLGALGALALHPYERPVASLAPFAAAFVAIACGNDLFGALSARTSRRLGEVSYGIYLVHGLVLYALFTHVPLAARASAWSPVGHWAVAVPAAALVTLLAWLAFRHVERPGVAATDAALRGLDALGTALGVALGTRARRAAGPVSRGARARARAAARPRRRAAPPAPR